MFRSSKWKKKKKPSRTSGRIVPPLEVEGKNKLEKMGIWLVGSESGAAPARASLERRLLSSPGIDRHWPRVTSPEAPEEYPRVACLSSTLIGVLWPRPFYLVRYDSRLVLSTRAGDNTNLSSGLILIVKETVSGSDLGFNSPAAGEGRDSTVRGSRGSAKNNEKNESPPASQRARQPPPTSTDEARRIDEFVGRVILSLTLPHPSPLLAAPLKPPDSTSRCRVQFYFYYYLLFRIPLSGPKIYRHSELLKKKGKLESAL